MKHETLLILGMMVMLMIGFTVVGYGAGYKTSIDIYNEKIANMTPDRGFSVPNMPEHLMENIPLNITVPEPEKIIEYVEIEVEKLVEIECDDTRLLQGKIVGLLRELHECQLINDTSYIDNLTAELKKKQVWIDSFDERVAIIEDEYENCSLWQGFE